LIFLAYRRLLTRMDVPVPPGSSPIKNFKELVKSLTLLILHNSEIRIWLFKIPKEHSGYGISELRLEDFQ
jgi:hypothetical protein